MQKRIHWMRRAAFAVTVAMGATVVAGDGGGTMSAPRTRAEVKKSVEAQKEAKPRLPLPPESERSRGNNGSMQRYYLPKEWQSARPAGAAFGGAPGGEKKREGNVEGGKGRVRGEGRPGAEGFASQAFGTEMFWIVSRTNDCRYCLGHQEAKLTNAGDTEERIAQLDGDWAGFTPADRAGLAYARKITLEPHLVGRADIDELRKHFSDAQIRSIVTMNAGYNRTNRWTGSLNIPQDREPMGRKETLDTPTPAEFAAKETAILPKQTIERPALESRAEVEKQIAAARARKPYISLPAAEAFKDATNSGEAGVPEWVRVAAANPEQAKATRRQMEAIWNVGKIPSLLKAQIAWVSARNDRAWYAVAYAKKRLKALGVSEDAIYALDNPESASLDAGTKEALAFAKKVTIYPQIMNDADFDRLKKYFGDFEVAEILWATGSANYFDRITEPLGLTVEE